MAKENVHGAGGYRSRYLSHAKRALYHLSYGPSGGIVMLEFTRCGTFSATGSSAAGHSTCPPTSVDGISGPLQPMSGFAMCAARGRGDLILSQAPLFASVLCISGLVVECIVAIDVTRVRFPAYAM